jgi:FkbM family methyltransferase
MNQLLAKFSPNSFGSKWTAAALATTYTNIIAKAGQFIYPQDGFWIHKSQNGYMVRRTIQSNVNVGYYLNKFDKLLWKQKPKYDDVAVIAGSGLGEEALLMSSLVGPKGKVIGLEPDKMSYGCHKLSVEMNNTPNTIVKQVALTAHGEDMHFVDFGDGEYVNNQAHTEATNGTYRVSSITLGDIFAEYKKVDFLYLNIEGGEEDVLFNSDEALLKQIPTIYVGCHGFLEHCPDNLQQMIIDRLESLNFKTEVRKFDETLLQTEPGLFTNEAEIAKRKQIMESWVFARNMSLQAA